MIIPEANVSHLMVDEEVIQSVRDGQSHIHAVVSVDEGLALLIGMEAGAPDECEEFPPGSVHGRVVSRPSAFAEADDDAEARSGEPARRS